MDQSLYSNLNASSNISNDGNTIINTNEDTKSETSLNQKRRRRETDYTYDDDSEYEERGDNEQGHTKRRAGRPKGSKNKPKTAQLYREEFIPPKSSVYEMPPFIPPTALSSCYSGSALEETYDEMIKVSENMSLISLKQECDARGCTYKRYKSIGKEELLFLLEPGTIAIHMTKVYNDLQILNRKLEGIKQENERIKTLKEEHRLQVLRDEEYMNQRQSWTSIPGSERIGSVIEDEERLRLRQQEILRLDLQSRERLEREQREFIQFGRYPSNVVDQKPIINNGLPATHGGWIPPPILSSYQQPLPSHILTSFPPDLPHYSIQGQYPSTNIQLDQASRLKLQTKNEMQRIIDENKKKLLAENAFIRSTFHSKCNLFETSRLIKGCSADHLADWMLCNWCGEVSNYACFDCLWSICKKCNNKED